MELREAIETRCSVRSFLPDAVAVEDLKEMVRLAACAPSANNYQPWYFIAVTDAALLGQMADSVSLRINEMPSNESRVAQNVKSQVEWYATFFRTAPALIAVCMEPYETILERGVDVSHDDINRARNYPDIQSAGAAIQNLLLAAVDLGYGACWLSAPMVASDLLAEKLKMPVNYKLIAFVAIGKAAGSIKPREKKNIDLIFDLRSA